MAALTSRAWLLLAASAFALTSIAAGLLLYLDPTPTSVSSVAVALALGLVCLHLATRAPSPRAIGGCPSCGALQDASLSFCARCGT